MVYPHYNSTFLHVLRKKSIERVGTEMERLELNWNENGTGEDVTDAIGRPKR